ncbi:MAG: phosphate ABC transporter permease subunit PstC, partial [Solirubrobacteraceae bacterium]
MASASITTPPSALTKARRRISDRIGEPGLQGLTWVAAAAATALIGLLVYKVFESSSSAFSAFGLGFVGHNVWDPTHRQFGGAAFLYGTAVSSFGALLLAGPTAVAISLFLTEMSPRLIRRSIATLVDLLAAIPSVVLGLWGIIVMSPVVAKAIEPALKSALGWIPLFAGASSPFGLIPAILVLTIMTVPIVSAVTREVFETVPADLKEGALALGATRWEMVRMVVLPYSRSGIVGALILGLGRALGEAVAVTLVIGNNEAIHAELSQPASTLAAQIVNSYEGATTSLEISSLIYLGAILLVLSLVANAVARVIVARTA